MAKKMPIMMNKEINLLCRFLVYLLLCSQLQFIESVQSHVLLQDDIEWFKQITSGRIMSILPMKNSGLCILHVLNVSVDNEQTLSSSVQKSTSSIVVFKAEQINNRQFENFRAELAAFHVDRILKFYKTPPVIGMKLSVRELKSKLVLCSQYNDFCQNESRWIQDTTSYLKFLQNKLLFRDRYGKGNIFN
jgi:hypothetical protein